MDMIFHGISMTLFPTMFEDAVIRFEPAHRFCRLLRRSGKLIAEAGGKSPFRAAAFMFKVRAQRLPLQIAAAWRSLGPSATRRYNPQSLSRTLAKTARNISCVSTPVLVL
jgi:hypothetical protein